jgi:DNA-directed RNA polymerase subunit RPC12/RpoP
MLASRRLNRRSFVVLASSLIPASRGLGLARFISSYIERSGSRASVIYVCPPCGLDCDQREFDKPGSCPVCGMKLIEKGAVPNASAALAGAVRFPSGQRSVELPFELLANAVFVQLQVNGKGPLLFSLDTGSANSVVASEIIGELGIKTEGTSRGMGSGTSFTSAKIPSLNLALGGGLELSTLQATAVSMAGLSNLIARRFDGDIGYDVLSQLVVKIDYEKTLLTLYDADHFEYQGLATSIPFKLRADYDPQIEGEISIPGHAPLPARIVLDTGAGGTILTTPFVKANRLMEKMKTLAAPDVGAGGGESTKWEGRAASLRIGPHVINDPLVALSSDAIGSLAHANFDINLGGNILRRFTVIIDYPRRRLMLEPNSHFHQPFPADASGVVLKAEGPRYQTFVVRAIVPNSPAVAAGLQVGDIIAGVKNLAINQDALWQLQELFKQAGHTYELMIRRGDKSFVRTIKLRSLL